MLDNNLQKLQMIISNLSLIRMKLNCGKSPYLTRYYYLTIGAAFKKNKLIKGAILTKVIMLVIVSFEYVIISFLVNINN